MVKVDSNQVPKTSLLHHSFSAIISMLTSNSARLLTPKGVRNKGGKITDVRPIMGPKGVVALIVVSIMLHCATARAQDNDSTDSVSVQDPVTQQTTQPKQKTDPFIWAIIGMSLGCMCIASSVHWTLTQRKRLTSNIDYLEDYLSNSCAVEFHIVGSRDNDPMLHMVKDIQENQSTQIREHANQKDAMVKRISDVESEIMRIWG